MSLKPDRTTLGEILYKMLYFKTKEQKKQIMQSEDYLIYERLFGRDKLLEYYERHIKQLAEHVEKKTDHRLGEKE